jgi:hypothetical protein
MAQFILDTSQLNQDVLGPVVFATGQADLGSVAATANAVVTNVVTATASLGGLTATASQFQPTPEPTGGGGGRRLFDTDRTLVNLRRPRPLPQPKVETLPEVKVTVVVKGRARTTSKFQASAESSITFSILDDDAEVLALL